MSTIVFLLTFIAASSALPHIPFVDKLDKCPDFEPMSDFNLDRYLGGWYEIERYPMIYELFTSCVWTNYTALQSDSKGTFLDIDMTYERFGEKDEGSLPAYKPNDKEGSFIIMPSENSKPNSFILKTDYDTYSLNYDCDSSLLGTNDFAWIYSRTKTLPQETIDDLKTFLKNMGSDTTKFKYQNQEDCDN